MARFSILEAVQAFLYTALAVTSLGIAGTVGEACDKASVSCPARHVSLIVFAVFVLLLALPMLAAYAFEIAFLKRIEIILVLGILLSNIVETSLASSRRTVGSGGFATELSWWSLLSGLLAFFLALSSGDPPKPEVPVKTDDTEAATLPAAAGCGSQDGRTM